MTKPPNSTAQIHAIVRKFAAAAKHTEVTLERAVADFGQLAVQLADFDMADPKYPLIQAMKENLDIVNDLVKDAEKAAEKASKKIAAALTEDPGSFESIDLHDDAYAALGQLASADLFVRYFNIYATHIAEVRAARK